jgi:AmiR/NasT family two-component response regulator
MYKCARLANQVTSATDQLEIPLVLQPILELGVMAEVREAEQDFQEARQLRSEFDKQVDKLAQRAVFKIRQGTQIRLQTPSPLLYGYGPFGSYVQ